MKVPWGSGEWSRAAVYGMGRSGTAATRLLRRRGVAVVGCDAEAASALELGDLATDPGVELRLGAEPETLPAEVDGIVVSPGVPRDRPLLVAAEKRGVPIIAEVELGYHLIDGVVVGVTGSNGKSTTVALTGALLVASGFRVETCGNIGRPLSDCVEGPPGRHFVVELSSFQLETTDTFRPRAAALLNLSLDHLDRHSDLAAYRDAKLRLFANQLEEDTAVVNADDPLVGEVATRARLRRFSTWSAVDDGCHRVDDRVVEVDEGAERPLFEAADLVLLGRHNLENAMAATLLALAVGGDPEVISTALRGFDGLPHRLERVAEIDGVVYCDDSKATNAAAVERALAAFAPGSVHLILGGQGKGEDPEAIVPALERAVRRVYLIGESATEFAAALGDRVSWVEAATMERAVELAAAAAEPGAVVLLSPACASFDQYDGFAERGDHFQRLVEHLDGERMDG